MPILNRLPILLSTARPVTLQHFSKRSFAIQPVLQNNLFRISSVQISLANSKLPLNIQLNRNYSPLPRKKVPRVAVEERPPLEEYQRQQKQQQPLVNQDQDQHLNAQQQQDAQFAAQNQTRQIDHVTAEVGAHLRKVYLTMGGTFGLAAVGSLASLFLSPVACMVLGIGSIVPALAIYFGTHSPENVGRRTLYLNAFGLLSGVGIAPLIKVALVMNPLYIAGAAGITAGIFGAMTALSLFMPSKSALRWGPALGGSCLILLACGIGSMFVPVTSALYPILHNVFLYAGLGVFSLFIAFDTQNIINDFEQGIDDHVRHSLDLFIDVFSIFRRILYMFISRDE